jgi:hypothetical protein
MYLLTTLTANAMHGRVLVYDTSTTIFAPIVDIFLYPPDQLYGFVQLGLKLLDNPTSEVANITEKVQGILSLRKSWPLLYQGST